MEAKESRWQLSTYPVNAPKEQDRAEDLIDNWRKYGYVMFPQQRGIYEQIAKRVVDKIVIEAGCGAGVGTEILSHFARKILGTDLEHNIRFAQCLYPCLGFGVWDILTPRPYGYEAEVVIAVEVIEHVADPIIALKNLIAAASEEVWISTPNGNGKPRPPENPYHVCEYTPAEMVEMIRGECSPMAIQILSWETFEPQSAHTTIDPLVYRIVL